LPTICSRGEDSTRGAAISFCGGLDYIGKSPGWGSKKHDEWTRSCYHQPCDEVEPSWTLAGQAENMRLVAEMVLAIANQEEMPNWLAGDEFAGVRTKDK
jgi:hypothetical protein